MLSEDMQASVPASGKVIRFYYGPFWHLHNGMLPTWVESQVNWPDFGKKILHPTSAVCITDPICPYLIKVFYFQQNG